MVPHELASSMTDHQRRIIQELLNGPNLKRNELADDLGLSPQTMMRAVNPLVEIGVLSEIEEMTGSRGKPPRLMSLRPGALLTLGITVTEDRNVIDLADLSGKSIGSIRIVTEFGSAQEQMKSLLSAIAEITEAHSASGRIVSIGVVVQGYYLSRGTRIVGRSDPEGWSTIDLAEVLEKTTGLRPTIVNDGKAFAASLVNPRLSANYIALFFGSGIGGGIVESGRLLSGAMGNAGEIGRFFQNGGNRPTEKNLLKLLGRKDWSEWGGIESLSTVDRQEFEQWIDGAAAQLSEALNLALALVDFDSVYIGSKAPTEVIEKLASKVSLLPLGADLGGKISAFAAPKPTVYARHIPSLSKLASTFAVKSFLQPEQLLQDIRDNTAPAVSA